MSLRVPLTVDSDQPRHALSFSIRYDHTRLELLDVDLEGTTLENAFWSRGTINQDAGEMVWSIILGLNVATDAFDPELMLAAGENLLVAHLVFDVIATEAGVASIAFEDRLESIFPSDVPFDTLNLLITGDDPPVSPELDSATIAIRDPSSPPAQFKRGDVDGNGFLEITDPISSLAFQFAGGFQPQCMDALDFDDSGAVDVSDPIGSLNLQFAGGAAPPAPGNETCGEDPTPDALSCELYPEASCN
jgi:hypothetical protein